MTEVAKMGADELRRRLKDFDRAVRLLHPDRSFRLVIVGGRALVLIGCLARATSDIDALIFPMDLTDLMDEFDVSGRVKAYEDEFADSLEERSYPSTSTTGRSSASRRLWKTW